MVQWTVLGRQLRRLGLAALVLMASRERFSPTTRRLALRSLARDVRGRPTAEVLAWSVAQPTSRPFVKPVKPWCTRAWVVEHAWLQAEMRACILWAATERGWKLRDFLAPAVVANAVACPVHGAGPCLQAGLVVRRGCIDRQLAALRIPPDRCSAPDLANCAGAEATAACEDSERAGVVE